MFNSATGFFQYCVGYNKDCYCTNSLEKMSYNEMVYHLLKKKDIKELFFLLIMVKHCRINILILFQG